jgi:PAS domain S-box-containing protein
MTVDPCLAPRLQALALAVLQTQIEGGDLGATLRRLVLGVADLYRARVLICRSTAAGALLALAGSDGAVMPAPDSGEARLLEHALLANGALSYGSWLAMPVQRYGLTLGVLALDTSGAVDLGTLAGQIDPVVNALASLLAAAAQGGEGASPAAGRAATPEPADGVAGTPVDVLAPVPAALLRRALRVSGTLVWEWDLPTDALSDIEEGAAMLGYAPGALGHTQRDWNRIIHPDDLEPLESSYLAHLGGHTAVYDHAYRARAADGSWRWLHERGRVVEWCADGSPRRMIGTQADVTERQTRQAHERELIDRLQHTVAGLPGLLVQYHQVPGRRGRFEYVSARALDLLGLSADELMDDALHAFGRLDQDDLAALLVQAVRCSASGTPLRAELRLSRGDAGQVWLRCHARAQAQDDGSVLWHAYVEDITGQRTTTVSASRAPAGHGEQRVRGDFLAQMSHELRTPLNTVLGFAQLLLGDTVEPPSSSQRARLSRIQDAGQHLQAMLVDLLDLAHRESVRLTVQQDAVPLAGLLHHCVELMRPLAERSGIAVHAEPVGVLEVSADRLRVQQILLNLIGNAIRYNRPQGWVRVSCTASSDARTARLEVVDSGPGMTAEQLERLFVPFNRLGREHSGIDGLGIGLALSRSLAEMMDGRIEVSSSPDQGSTFTLCLPLRQPARPAG